MKAVITMVAVAIVAALATLVTTGALFNVAFYKLENEIFSLKDIYVITEINRLEAIKFGLPYVANYSFCQALYDVSKVGGYQSVPQDFSANGIAIWRNYSKAVFPNYHFNITNRTLDIAKQYLSEYGGVYDSVSMEELNDYVKLNLTSENLIEYTAPVVELVLKQNPNVSIKFSTRMKKMYDLGKENFIYKDSIKLARRDAYTSLAQDCKTISMGNVCEQQINPETELSEKCPNADNNFKNLFASKIENLQGDYSGVSLTTSIEDVIAQHTSTYSYSRSEDSEDCGCKTWGDWETVQNDTVCSDWCTNNGYDDSRFVNDECQCRICSDWYNMTYDVNYEYNYYAAAKVLISIKDNDNACPAYDNGYTDYRNTVLNFYVISGNKELVS
jgi:hypothetical protein